MHLSLDLILAQTMLGLNQGVFYAMLSLGLAIIFGLLNIVNFAHGAFYMIGAFVALLGYGYLGPWLGDSGFRINFWVSLIISPVLVGALGILFERSILRRLYGLDPIYGLLLTFSLALILQGIFQNYFNVSGTPYHGQPKILSGAVDLGFMTYPAYRLFTIIVSLIICLTTWFAIEKSKWGIVLRASIERPALTQALGVNVPLLVTLTFGFGIGLAALTGVLAAPIYSVSPLMGADLLITIFAVVVVGGLGSIKGAIIGGLVLGLLQGLTKAIYPPMASTVIFIIMAIVLLIKPAGLFGRE